MTKYRWAVWYKANPRSEEYMRALFTERYPGSAFINVDEDNNWSNEVQKADTVVLLYPDAIGLGFYLLEGKVRRLKRGWAAVRVLNGRRRDFLLNRVTLCGLRLRRLMEHGMLGEVVATVLFVVLTPVLLGGDWLRGNR